MDVKHKQQLLFLAIGAKDRFEKSAAHKQANPVAAIKNIGKVLKKFKKEAPTAGEVVTGTGLGVGAGAAGLAAGKAVQNAVMPKPKPTPKAPKPATRAVGPQMK